MICPAQGDLAPWDGIFGSSSLLSHSPCWASFLQNPGGAWPTGGCQSVLAGTLWGSPVGVSWESLWVLGQINVQGCSWVKV